MQSGTLLRWLTLARLITALTFIAVFVGAAKTPIDTDTFWHLRAGEWQVQHRELLTIDVFSHTRYSAPWINHSWLSQIVIYGAYALFGDAGLALYTSVLATAGMGFMHRQMEGDALVKASVTILTAATAAVFWSARPQMISFFLSTVILYLLWLYLKRGIDKLWVTPLLFLVWGNMHAGFAIGFILIGLALFGVLAERLFERNSAPKQQPDIHRAVSVRRIALVGLVSAAAVSINPYGPAMLIYPFQTVGIGVLRDYIQEWSSPTFHELWSWPFIWMLLGLMVTAGLSRRRLGWVDAVMVCGTAFSAVLAWRNVATFAIVAAGPLSIHLSAWLKDHRYQLNWDRITRSAGLITMNWLILILIVAAGIGQVIYSLNHESVLAERTKTLPVHAVNFLRSEHSPGPMFNSYNWGGYLIWMARDYPVYVDGRTDLYDDELLQVQLNTAFAREGWQQNLDSAGINLVLIERGSSLARVMALDEDWTRIYLDEIAVIFQRRVLTGTP